VKLKGRRCSTGHGTGLIQEQTLWRRLWRRAVGVDGRMGQRPVRVRLRLGLERQPAMRDHRGRCIPRKTQAYYRGSQGQAHRFHTDLKGFWERVMLAMAKRPLGQLFAPPGERKD